MARESRPEKSRCRGRLLTAWSVAGILGPVLVNYWNEYQVRAGVPRARAYDQTMLLLAGMLVAGFFCNLLVRPVKRPHALGDDYAGGTPTSLSAAQHPSGPREPTRTITFDGPTDAGSRVWLVMLWLLVAVPLAWGVWMTMRQAWLLLG